MSKRELSLLSAVDKLSHAVHLFEAALMAASEIDDPRQRGALDAVLIEAIGQLKEGTAEVDTIRMQKLPAAA
jgi:hypothetical protein